mmetsp:Transcript_4718/g.11495  ORF Transcript_4718/g.11495 Transcript_4718/m.11495 type:complete len:267 (-) Transcript_4718:303-1103(-)
MSNSLACVEAAEPLQARCLQRSGAAGVIFESNLTYRACAARVFYARIAPVEPNHLVFVEAAGSGDLGVLQGVRYGVILLKSDLARRLSAACVHDLARPPLSPDLLSRLKTTQAREDGCFQSVRGGIGVFKHHLARHATSTCVLDLGLAIVDDDFLAELEAAEVLQRRCFHKPRDRMVLPDDFALQALAASISDGTPAPLEKDLLSRREAVLELKALEEERRPLIDVGGMDNLRRRVAVLKGNLVAVVRFHLGHHSFGVIHHDLLAL